MQAEADEPEAMSLEQTAEDSYQAGYVNGYAAPRRTPNPWLFWYGVLCGVGLSLLVSAYHSVIFNPCKPPV